MRLPGSDREAPFLIFASFLTTFIISRLTVYFLPTFFINIRGVHIHHYAYGIVILTIAGLYDLIVRPNEEDTDKIALIFGIGLALAYDEFGMWLRLRDFYPTRDSYDAIIIIGLILLNIIYFDGFWKKIGKRIFRIK